MTGLRLSPKIMPFVLAILSGCARPETTVADMRSKPSIWGGQRVEASDPLAGATVALIRSNGYPFCTGSFMGANIVLTAAHCVTDVESPLLYVSFDLEAPTEFDPLYGDRGPNSAKSRVVKRILVHAGFDRDRFTKSNIKREPTAPLNDVALVFFSGDAPFDARAVKLIEPGFALKDGDEITLAGFGRSDAQGGDYGRLYKVGTHVGEIRNTSLEIVDGPNVRKGSCIGDSGGPVVVSAPASPGGMANLTVTGLVSYGPSECASGTGFNTDLRYFRDWVRINQKNAIASQAPYFGSTTDLQSFVPTGEGSFYQMCQSRVLPREDAHTLSALLSKFGTSDCYDAARVALRTTTLNLSGQDITSIRVLRHLVSLESLDLSYNRIEELSPISYLGNLRELNLFEAGIRWADYKHPSALAPWNERFASSFRRPAPYTQGIWLSALKRLRVLTTSGSVAPDLTPRYANDAR